MESLILIAVPLLVIGWIVVVIIRTVFRAGSKALDVGLNAAGEYVESRALGDKHEEALRSAALRGLVVAFQSESGEDAPRDEKVSQELSEDAFQEQARSAALQTAYGVMESKGCCYECHKLVYYFSTAGGDLLVLDSLDRPYMIHACDSLNSADWAEPADSGREWELFHFVSIGENRLKGRFIVDGRAGGIEEFRILRRLGSNWSHYWNYEPVFISRIVERCYRIESVTLYSGSVIRLQLDIELEAP